MHAKNKTGYYYHSNLYFEKQMPRQAKRGRKISTCKVTNGFCISCGASKSSRFRSAPSKWEAFYQFYNEERHEKKKRICSNCYLKLSKACKASTMSNEQGSSAMNRTDSNTTDQVSVIVKPSPIGGNGQWDTFYCTVLMCFFKAFLHYEILSKEKSLHNTEEEYCHQRI